jgi:hypothetical protein
MRKKVAAVIAAVVIVSGSAWSHHSTALFLDDDAKRLTLTGTLTKVDWRAPHIHFSVDLPAGQGRAESWSIESRLSPNLMAERKVSKTTFEKAIGQTVTMEISPARDGSRFGLLRKVTFPDGTTLES